MKRQKVAFDKETLRRYETQKNKLVAIRENDMRSKSFRYPPCPVCNARGEKGLHLTKLGNVTKKVEQGHCLRCKGCNRLFEVIINKDFKPKILREI